MRAGVLAAVVIVALSLCASAQTTATPTRAQIRLMPLPQGAYGSAASTFKVDSNSGWVSNEESASNDLDPHLTAAKLAGMGRITGFDADFNNLSTVSRPGQLVDADSEVDLFKSPAGAAEYAAFESTELRRLSGKRLQYGFVVDDVSYFAVPGISGARGIHARIRAGGLTAWITGVGFHKGLVAANVGLSRTDDRDIRAVALRDAAALSSRIDGVLAGRIHGKPLTAPHAQLGGLGPVPGGPDLAAMAIQPGDFVGRAKPVGQGYVRNSDDVAEYDRQFQLVTFGSSPIGLLKAEVELRPSTKDAGDFVSLLDSFFRGPRGRTFMTNAIVAGIPPSERKSIHVDHLALLNVKAGDRATAYRARLRINGITFQSSICAVQRGPVIETLTILSVPKGKVELTDVRRIALTAAARITQALR